MSEPIFPRGVLTDALLDVLEVALQPDILVGDGIAPEPAGWTGGQPGEGDFISYVTLNTGPARKNIASRQTLGRDNTAWVAGYTLTNVGALRQQCDWTADRTRSALTEGTLEALEFSPGWRILLVEFTGLGGLTRNSSVNPPYWELTDNVDLWLERAR